MQSLRMSLHQNASTTIHEDSVSRSVNTRRSVLLGFTLPGFLLLAFSLSP